MDQSEYVRLFLLISFVMFIPLSAVCYYRSRRDQRTSEIGRYMKILNIKDKDLFEQKHQGFSFLVSVFFVTLLSVCFWGLILFGNDINLGGKYSYLFGNIRMMTSDDDSFGCFQQYQSGALLTFNMAFLGAYLWGIQSIVRRYSMNDLIPVSYYNLGVRMIFASILALAIYHLAEATPNILASIISAEPGSSGNGESGSHLIMPIFAFLIGMFPQRGLKWLTEKFSVFSDKGDPSVKPLPLEMIEGITIYDRVRLQELGIDSCYDMANVDYVPCLFKTPYSPRVLINWVLQAKLCVYFGGHVKELREHGIHTVWQFNNYEMDDLRNLVKSTPLTEDTLVSVKGLIEKDLEISRLVAAQVELSRYWNKDSDESEATESDS